MKCLSNKKGQGAMEYLMTHAWAILVLMIVGVALYKFGVFSSIFGSGTNHALGFTGKLGVADGSIKCTTGAAGNLTATLLNRGGSVLSVSSFNVIDGGGCATGAANISPASMDAGKTATLAISCPNNGVGTVVSPMVDVNYVHRVAGEPVAGTITGAQIVCTVE